MALVQAYAPLAQAAAGEHHDPFPVRCRQGTPGCVGIAVKEEAEPFEAPRQLSQAQAEIGQAAVLLACTQPAGPAHRAVVVEQDQPVLGGEREIVWGAVSVDEARLMKAV